MSQGEEVKTKSESEVEIQERGEIFFFYRPKVDREEAHSVDDVQRFYVVMRPESGEHAVQEKQSPDSDKEGKLQSEEEKGEGSSKTLKPNEEGSGGGGGGGEVWEKEVNIAQQASFRLMVIGRKKLPDPTERSRPYWGFVELVTTKTEDIKNALKGEEYDTSTRGRRHNPPARAVGEGVYCILRHKQGRRNPHTHLIYKLELPPEGKANEPQESLNVEREASYVIQVKNPEADNNTGGGVQRKKKAVFPAHLQGRFGKRRFVPADPPDLLNYEGCEFLMVSASDDVGEELGLELRTEGEVRENCSSDLMEMFGDTTSAKPLLSGSWD